jgi:hypothetical protein
MCRWLAYSGDPILLESFLFEAKHSLIDQSMSSKSAETPTMVLGSAGMPTKSTLGSFAASDRPGTISISAI